MADVKALIKKRGTIKASISVSYTHLDVYKRQGYDKTFVIRQ